MALSVSERDERLALLLACLDGERRQGKIPDVERLARENPELADELRSLWATAQFAQAFVQPKPQPVSTVNQIATAPVMQGPTLPRFFDDYELLQELGRGGMGVVFKAHQKSLDRLVAIKMMRETRLSSESDQARFREEAASVARLTHPRIVTVHEVGEVDGYPYFVMEYVDGPTLSQWIATHGPLSSRDAATLVAQIARAVQHAHEHGILHRDLKPANILLKRSEVPSSDTSGATFPLNEPTTDASRAGTSPMFPLAAFHAKITDFGLAKRLNRDPGKTPGWKTQTGAIVGTPGYMAPEQASGRKDLSPATDVYSLGAILYELLTGRPPFQAANPVDTLLMVIEQEPVPPRWLDPGIDRDLEQICLKCLQKPPELRYATASELAEDLEAFLSGENVSSPPSGLRYFLSRMLRETHHASVLENWGLLWMWHSLATFILCLLTQVMAWSKVEDHRAYLILWSVGLIAWGSILWQLRRRAGPVLFVERQIAHSWAAGVCASIAMFVIEVLVKLPVLTLSPAIAVAAGMVFVFKAGILSGRFYLTAGAMFLTACVMPLLPDIGILLFGIATALSFFIPGLKYYRLRKRAREGVGVL